MIPLQQVETVEAQSDLDHSYSHSDSLALAQIKTPTEAESSLLNLISSVFDQDSASMQRSTIHQEQRLEMVTFDTRAFTQPPAQTESPLGFFIEPSTYVNLPDLFHSVFGQHETSHVHMTMTSMQQFTTHQKQPLQVSIPSWPSTVRPVFGQTPLQQQVVFGDENDDKNQSEQFGKIESFSDTFTSQRRFGFTKTAKLENNQLLVLKQINITIANERSVYTYLNMMRDAKN